jgi:hypothetical protein
MIALIDNPMTFRLRQGINFGQQRPIQRGSTIGEHMHVHRTAGGDFARLKSTRALVAFQVEKLKPIGEWHSVLL